MNDEIATRIAVALEQIALELAGWPKTATVESVGLLAAPSEDVVPWPGGAQPAPIGTLPPLTPLAAPAQAPVAPQFQFTGVPQFSEGMNHAAGHKPLKRNAKGLYCPTKLQDGSWCPWKVPA